MRHGDLEASEEVGLVDVHHAQDNLRPGLLDHLARPLLLRSHGFGENIG